MGLVKRRPQPPREPRDHITEIRWTSAERRQVGRAAHDNGLSISSLIRSVVLSAIGQAGRDDEAIEPSEGSING